MALEKWLYELVEEGEKIDSWVETIFDKSSSLALAGVLVAVGLKNPQLFTGVLQPLLGNLALYQYQLHLALQESQEVWTIGMVLWTNHGERVFGLVQEWHRLPHRKLMLQDAAVELMLFDEGTKGYLSKRRQEWAKVLDSGSEERERLEFFLARFDPDNYTMTKLSDG
jgi:hypothetical protein